MEKTGFGLIFKQKLITYNYLCKKAKEDVLRFIKKGKLNYFVGR